MARGVEATTIERPGRAHRGKKHNLRRARVLVKSLVRKSPQHRSTQP